MKFNTHFCLSTFSEPLIDELLQQELTTVHLQEMEDLVKSEDGIDQAPSTKLSDESKEKWAEFFEQKLQQLENENDSKMPFFNQ